MLLFDDDMVKMLFVGDGIKWKQEDMPPPWANKPTQIVDYEHLETNESFDSESSQPHPVVQEYIA